MTNWGDFFLGWGSGLLSALIGAAAPVALGRWWNKKEVRQGLNTELGAIRLRCILMFYRLSAHLRTLDRQTLEMIQTQLKDTDGGEDFGTSINKLLEAGDAALQIAMQTGASAQMLSKLTVPFMEANMPAIARYKPEVRRQLLEVHAQIGFLSEKGDEAKALMHKTFDSDIAPNNRTIIEQNLQGVYRDVAMRCMHVSKTIGSIRI